MVKILSVATQVIIILLYIYTWKAAEANADNFIKGYVYFYLALVLCSLLADKYFYTGQKTESKKENELTSIFLFLFWFALLAVPVLEYVFFRRENIIVTLIGTLLIVVGTAVRGAAIKTLGKYFSRDVETWDNHSIVKSGIYKHIRHPAYAGNILQAVGFPLVLNSYLTLILSTITIIAFIWRIEVEERFLAKHHPEYRKYMEESKRIIPKVW